MTPATPATTSSTEQWGLTPLTVADAHRLSVLIDEAQAGLEHCLSEARNVLQQRCLTDLWDDEAAAFLPSFQPLAERYHQLQRSLQVLNGGETGWTHDLSTFVEAQR